MSPYNKVSTSGEGSRPVTDAAADNIGAGKKFVPPKEGAEGEVNAPESPEKMAAKRSNAANSAKDDLDIFGMHEDLRPEGNTEPVPPRGNVPPDKK